ncbi:MAG TPA: SOS response-associated peptidase [Stellaceae bacterium]|jgi:putative SOS response-associated peptidase YedK|nr:SOS response-associated peptidase [Stellaceae bacterium]
MCNFFTRHREPRNLAAAFRFPELPNDPPRWVVRPTDTERVVAVGKDGQRHAIPMRWGLVPYWAKDIKTGLTLFNWQSETVMEKRTFAEPFKRGHRCLVPCDGFFEFTGEKGNKQPWLLKPKDNRVMAFAGLWDQWKGPQDAAPAPLAAPLLSFSIATCAPNATVAPIHDRMPVLFAREAEWDAWLHPDAAPDELKKMLVPAPDDLLDAFPVSRDLLRTKEPGPELLMPEL